MNSLSIKLFILELSSLEMVALIGPMYFKIFVPPPIKMNYNKQTVLTIEIFVMYTYYPIT